MMNIGQVLRGFLGDLQFNENKVLELKAGQIVKGIVLKLLAGQDALIQISGVQVKAKLETPLQKGQVTLLQVQPDSAGGAILLKPLQTLSPQGEGYIPEILQNLGLKNTSVHRQLVQLMIQEQIPLTKENVQLLMQSIQIGDGSAGTPADSAALLRAAVVAFQKQLPLHPDTVHALHQVLFGKPLHQLLRQVEQEAAAILQDRAGRAVPREGKVPMPAAANAAVAGSAPDRPALTELLGRLQNTLKQVMQLSQSVGNDRPLPAAPAAEPAAGNASLRAKPEAGGERPANAPQWEGRLPDNAGKAPVHALSPNRPAGEPASGPAVRPDQPAGEAKPAPAAPATSQPSAASSAGGRAAMPAEGELAAARDRLWLSTLLRMVGLDHEKQAVLHLRQQPSAPADKDPAAALKMPLPTPFADSPDSPQQQAADSRLDNLKSLLLQMTSSDDVPSSLKQNMQQLLQHITGQQLLMLGDKASMFAQIHVSVPLYNAAGEQTASIQIQSRKGKNGGLDSKNCRLIFDLNMQALGDTLIDVQVIDRMVSLQVHNDHPMISELLEGHRDEINRGLEAIGYRFMSLKSQPFPQKNDRESDQHGSADAVSAPFGESYAARPYKGVDVRI